MQPSEFWGLSPAEWWAEFDARVSDSEKLKASMDQKPGGKGMSAFSRAEWEDARRRHHQKMKAAKNGGRTRST